MTTKTVRVYTLDELKEKSRKALADPKLVEIVKNTPLNKDGKVNLSWSYLKAEDYVHEQTKDLQKTKELAVATRFLAKLRRDHAEEFERLIAQKEQPKLEAIPVWPEKRFTDEEFKIPTETELIVRYGRDLHDPYNNIYSIIRARHYIRFCNPLTVNVFFMEILNALFATESDISMLLNDLIQLLEEKCGLKVKVCGNCKYFSKSGYINGELRCNKVIDMSTPKIGLDIELWRDTKEFNSCKNWTLKILKKES